MTGLCLAEMGEIPGSITELSQICVSPASSQNIVAGSQGIGMFSLSPSSTPIAGAPRPATGLVSMVARSRRRPPTLSAVLMAEEDTPLDVGPPPVVPGAKRSMQLPRNASARGDASLSGRLLTDLVPVREPCTECSPAPSPFSKAVLSSPARIKSGLHLMRPDKVASLLQTSLSRVKFAESSSKPWRSMSSASRARSFARAAGVPGAEVMEIRAF